jgi:hypothetical protein
MLSTRNGSFLYYLKNEKAVSYYFAFSLLSLIQHIQIVSMLDPYSVLSLRPTSVVTEKVPICFELDNPDLASVQLLRTRDRNLNDYVKL